ECGIRLHFDTGLSFQHERFDNFPNAATEDAWIAQIARDPAYRVVVIGDSVMVGASLIKKGETPPSYLERALTGAIPRRDVHVWNLSLAGARATDQLCLLEKVLEARPDFVVISGNYITFRDEIAQMPLAHPWLAWN